MNTSRLKTFAPAVRRQLMEAVGRKLDYVLTADTPDLRQASRQVAVLRREAEKDRTSLVERVTYTWFNRLAALRFLDARGWHPFSARVLTPASPDETQPEILQLLRTGTLPAELRPHTDLQRLNDLLDGHLPTAIAGADPQGEVYRGLVLAACRFYHALMPFLFESLDDETELLLPDDLLTATSVAEGFRTEISDGDCGNVELLGWLYQFYISERKDQVMARKSAVLTEDIPAVTQLFTPHWIVRYLVENSLGRLWLLNRPGSRLREHMPYYIEGEAETDFLKITKPEDIRLCDPAVGSGHMLTYAFDLLTLIYEEEGYAPTEIPALILRHNLHGLEICPRAAQLAELALVFKAREKSRRFFQPEHLVRPRIIELRDVRFAEGELRDYIHALGLGDLFNQPVLRLLLQFEEAKNFGSLIQPCLDERAIADVRRAIEAKDLGGQLFLRETHLKVLLVLEQAEALTQRYHVVVANPPYMTGGMNGQLSAMVTANFADSRSDLSATFITRSRRFCLPAGLCGLVTMHSWMFLPTLADFRKDLLSSCRIFNLAHHGIGAFPTLNSKVVQTVAFAFCVSTPKPNDAPVCFRLLDYDPVVKERQLRAREKRFANVRQNDFSKIEGWPLAYWLSEAIIASFQQSPIRSTYTLKEGLGTRNDPYFLRCFWEIGLNRTRSATDAQAKWIRTDKAGAARKWYGNHYSVMNWENDGFEIKNYRNPDGTLKSRPQNTQFFFRQAVTWGKVGTISKTFRLRDSDLAFNDAAPSAFGENLLYLLALLNSKVFEALLDVQGDTMNVTLGVVGILPFIALEHENQHITASSQECVSIARADWDNFETSWDFRDQPLLRPGLKGATLEVSWRNWEAQSAAAVRRMQELETENNRLFIAAYGLDGELQPEVPEAQITLARAEARRDMAAFLSYAVGCMMGRYSPDHPGLILADAGDTVEHYLAKIGKGSGPLDPDRAIREPETVALAPNARPKCFACGTDLQPSEAQFILADLYDREPDQICGRPMIYCPACVTSKKDNIVLTIPLQNLSLAKGLESKWAEPETFKIFIEMTECFGHRRPALLEDVTFPPDEDGIIPVLDGEWFEDDIVARTREFLRVTFGEATLNENLRFIEDSLGKPLDKYFLTDFYKDHLQTYKKRPIYWLFQSPKKGFSALVYLHRYTKDTVNTLLNKYLRDYLHKLESRIAHLIQVEATGANPREKTAARKEREKLEKALKDCREWEREVILPLAQKRLEIDLDDGVKVNYGKFDGAVAPIAGLAAKED